MTLTGLHLLLTYRCLYECDHCFLFGSPSQKGTMTLSQIREVYRQAHELGTIEWIFLEGGEPFLYFPIVERAAREAVEAGFRVGVVSNGYWATSVEDAQAWLRPLAGMVDVLSVSTDLFHGDELLSEQARNSMEAAERLGMPHDTIVCETPQSPDAPATQAPGEPVESGAIRFRGRAAEKLAPDVELEPLSWKSFRECPDETLDAPSRVHVDHLGNLHVCQGIVMGNLFEKPLKAIVAEYLPQSDPIIGPLVRGGPRALVGELALEHEDEYLDACHLCYSMRRTLRSRFPEILRPAQAYGVATDDR